MMKTMTQMMKSQAETIAELKAGKLSRTKTPPPRPQQNPSDENPSSGNPKQRKHPRSDGKDKINDDKKGNHIDLPEVHDPIDDA